MIGGMELLDDLRDSGKQWLVIHGHQHVPHLMYADAAPFSPVVLSAGSAAAKTWRVKGGHARNQIHHISIDLSKIEEGGSQIFGQITSWAWAFESGWVAAEGTGVIPYKSGFGYRFDPQAVRDTIVAAARAAHPNLLSWEQLTKANEKLHYLLPSDRAALIRMVREKGIKIEVDAFGIPIKMESPL
jgi:hypothetical protein